MASSSSSIASVTESSSTYDVFINFRGKDLRNSFIGFLYKIMKDRGIDAFLDSEKLWIGEAIGPALYEAIRGSKISIPVFSEGYADSKWCLEELVEIVQCYESNNQIILPIFFNIDPSDVRHQTGTFEKAFLEHQKKFDPKKVESWKEALRVVGNLKGEVLDNTTNQAEVVELVVKRALRELVNNTRLLEGEYRIDMDSRVKDLSSLLNIASNDVQFVGICGFGGIGKTTLAKAVYNEILSIFDYRCFLSDVRERATQFGGLVSLQKQFLKDIFKVDFDIGDLHRGKGLIKEKISQKKVFLVLDDIDSKEQIDALAGNLNWFGKGSKVIITTRDECVLDLAKVNGRKIYRPQLLDLEHSLQLFSWHAFQNNQPPKDYMQLSHDVVHHSEGLPLILEVFGSYMSDLSDKDEWKSALKTLKEIPPREVQRRLQISYDNLENDYQKNIFLDAACFFIGWEKEILVSIWESLGFNPKLAISRLIKRSLLKFDGECLIMHDYIRNMGREIVLEESRENPDKRSRLWSYGDVVEILRGHKETDTIKGMSYMHGPEPPCYLSDPEAPFDLSTESLELMPNLRFLHVTLSFECFMDRSFQLSDFYHRRLVCLKLSYDGSNKFWNVRPPDKDKRFQKLKILDHSNCYDLPKSPNFSWFPSLEQLHFQECHSLKELDESIGQLSQLKGLFLDSCTSLKKLPNSISDLKTLEKLDLSGTEIKKLPDSISQMCSLKELILRSCYSLKKLPDGVGLLRKLELLDCEYCMALEKLPRSFGGMRCLDRIELRRIAITKFHDDFSMPPNLKELTINSLTQFNSLPASLSDLKTLKQLQIWNCGQLEYILELPSCLVELCIRNCDSLVRLPDLSKLKMLRTLRLRNCKKLKEIPSLEKIESLYELDVGGSFNLTFTQENIQRPLSPENVSLATSRIILSLVLKISRHPWFPLESTWTNIYASIHKKDKKVSCLHSLSEQNVEYSIDGEVSYICHFRGFDWFGVPLHENDKIEILRIDADGWLVKFCKILSMNRELGTQTPCQNSNTLMMVPDLYGEEEDLSEENFPKVYVLSRLRLLDSVSDAMAEEEEDMLRPGKRVCLQNDIPDLTGC